MARIPLMESTLLPPPETAAPTLSRRSFLRVAAGAAGGLMVYAGEVSRHELQIIDRTIALRRLPDAFAGMKIVQISDFHFEEYTEASFLQAVVSRVNALKPDLVLLTGDFVSSRPLPWRYTIGLGHHCAELLSRLECPLRYAILGNHDTLVGESAIAEALETHGIPVLANRYVPLERGRQRLWLAGIRDALEGRPDVDAATPPGRHGEPLILLSHEPDFADSLIGREVDLVLSGHTHGGQIIFPFLPPLLLPELGRRYVHGHFRFPDGMQLYVNRGIGAVTLPFRFRCPPEITVITLARMA